MLDTPLKTAPGVTDKINDVDQSDSLIGQKRLFNQLKSFNDPQSSPLKLQKHSLPNSRPIVPSPSGPDLNRRNSGKKNVGAMKATRHIFMGEKRKKFQEIGSHSNCELIDQNQNLLLIKFRICVSGHPIEDQFLWPKDEQDVRQIKIFAM